MITVFSGYLMDTFSVLSLIAFAIAIITCTIDWMTDLIKSCQIFIQNSITDTFSVVYMLLYAFILRATHRATNVLNP